MLDQYAAIATIVSGIAVVVSLAYAAVQIRQNTKAVSSAAYAQVIASFSEYAFEVAQNGELVDITLRGNRDFASLSEAERLRFELSLLSFLRRAENVLFQSNSRLLGTDHWLGIRNSIGDVLSPPGSRTAWARIAHRLNPAFREWVEALLQEREA